MSTERIKHRLLVVNLRGVAAWGALILAPACEDIEAWRRSGLILEWRRKHFAKTILTDVRKCLNLPRRAQNEGLYEMIGRVAYLSNGFTASKEDVERAMYRIHLYFTNLDFIYSSLAMDGRDSDQVRQALGEMGGLGANESRVDLNAVADLLDQFGNRSGDDPFGEAPPAELWSKVLERCPFLTNE